MGVATREVGKCRAPPDASPGEGIPALEVAVGGTAPAKVLEVIGSLAVAGSLSATRTHAEEVVMASSEEGTAMAKGSGSVTATGTHAEEVRMAGTVAPLLGSMSGEKGSATAKGSGIAGSLAASLMVSEEKAVVGIGSISTPPTNYSEKCCVCDQPSGVRICGRCTAQLKESLLSVTFDEGCENMFYCLECFDMVQGDHTHREKIIPILKCSGSVFAIVTGGESWASLFGDIQSEPGCLRRLHPPQGDKCEVCFDVVESDTQGPHVRYCTIECWLRGETVVSFPILWVADLVYEDYEAKQRICVDAFCIDCHCFFCAKQRSSYQP